jgi:hypothetical protein
MASIATAICSAASLTVSNVGTSITNQLTADTGLTAQERAIITALSSAIQSSQPSSSIHSGTL